MIKLAIVIPCFNNWNLTKSCLEDLLKLPEIDHQIIIVDNASSDKTKSWSESKDPTKFFNKTNNFLQVIRNPVNLGFAKACNIGFAKAAQNGAENIMFLNNDIKVFDNFSNWTKDIIQESENNKIVGPTIGCLDSNFNFICEGKKIPLNHKNWYMSGWNITAPTKIWNQLKLNFQGPFSEEFGLGFFEDTDLSFRAKEIGIDFSVVSIPVRHLGHQTANNIGTSSLYNYARPIFIKKWKK